MNINSQVATVTYSGSSGEDVTKVEQTRLWSRRRRLSCRFLSHQRCRFWSRCWFRLLQKHTKRTNLTKGTLEWTNKSINKTNKRNIGIFNDNAKQISVLTRLLHLNTDHCKILDIPLKPNIKWRAMTSYSLWDCADCDSWRACATEPSSEQNNGKQ